MCIATLADPRDGRARGQPRSVAMDCRLYLTYRSEYLVLGDLCVGVRDRRSSQWLPAHAGACSKVLGMLASRDGEHWLPTTRARIGEHLCLEVSPRRLVTSPIVAVEVPSRSLVQRAEEQWHDLFAPRSPHATKIVLLQELEE